MEILCPEEKKAIDKALEELINIAEKVENPTPVFEKKPKILRDAIINYEEVSLRLSECLRKRYKEIYGNWD